MSRIESGKMTLDEAEVHLPDVIHDLRTIIHANITAKQLNLFIDTQDVVNEDIITDKLRLNQVFLNILSNAIKFTPNGGTISFSVIEKASPIPDHAVFEFRIRDTGIGMSKEYQKTIFEAFTREKTSTVSGIQGTGLGMAITKSIVDMMGGTISVSSEEGKGTEFIVTIPCLLNGSIENQDEIPELQGLRVLVVDDDTDLLHAAVDRHAAGLDKPGKGVRHTREGCHEAVGCIQRLYHRLADTGYEWRGGRQAGAQSDR